MGNKRLFISFAMEDKTSRDLLVGQRNNGGTPIEFTDMSVKQAWDNKWKTNCRVRIKGCHGVIALVSKNTKNAAGQLWEVKCALEEGKPVLGIYTTKYNRPLSLPSEFSSVRAKDWTWSNIEAFINTL